MYTIAKRKEIYKEALKCLIDDIIYRGICHAISIASNSNRVYYFMEKEFPELYIHKQENYGAYWYPLDEDHKKIRIAILEDCIKQCEEQIK